MIVSNRVEIAVNKVLNGYMSNFDFIIEFSDINSIELYNLLLTEMKYLYQAAFMLHSLDYAYDKDGNVVDILETLEPYYPIHIESLKMIIDHFENQISTDTLNIPNAETEIDIDSSLTEKIIFLHNLGVIEFLRKSPPFNTSTNKLAKIIGAITGGRVTTIQPMLNPIINDQVDQSKNPLKSNIPVEKVRQMLVYLGYKND